MEEYRSGCNGPDSKSGCRASGTRVRIPPLPPFWGFSPHQQSMVCQNMTGHFYKAAEGIADESLEAKNLAT